ncbi:ABC-F type ribosomal protection protein [Paenactinomyces guangxiensis]|uniref:ABC-F type ribosomal protection protein n=1 Tax=Paenactinomyces guangxiensis TaxID=1490290 RepID=A0A7W2A7G0_9BACL|nr:ABC-F type ribosomal protection protein [Paenactinomyces guangxiensis]MBH8590051.1 ABC-F type ribosomal protection protein [Paenactinomyces guangxiensis]
MVCACHQMKKMLGAEWVLKQIEAEVHDGARIGLVGANGSGKTTLLKCIAGMESPDHGEIFIRKKAKVGYLAQISDVTLGTTVKQVLERPFAELFRIEQKIRQISEQMAEQYEDPDRLEKLLQDWDALQQRFAEEGGYQIESRIARVSKGLGINEQMWEQSFHSLSGGEQTKVGLATLLLGDPDLLLLDEPTNHLDLRAIEWLEEYLDKYQGAVIVVSHDRYFLDRVTRETWDLEDGEVTVYRGSYSSFVRQKEEKLLLEFQAYQEQEKKIKKMKDTIKRLKEWANRANPPNAGMHRRAKSMEKALERMEKIQRPILERKKMSLQFEMMDRSGNDVVMVEKLGKIVAERLLFADVDMMVRFQERCAIVGANGTGKSTLLRILSGQEQADEGTVRLGAGVKAGYLSQAGYDGDLEQTVIEAFRDQVDVTEGEARHILARFLFYGYAVFRKVKELSGGERMRLRLAQLMYQDINLLMLDEPTNHLDIDSREVLEEALAGFSGTVIAVSHDRYFLNRLFGTIYWLENQSVTRYEGNYDWAKSRRNKALI